MAEKELIQLFGEQKVRTKWDDEKQKWYSDKWINQRLKSIEVRKELTDEWDRAGVKEGQHYDK